jgi:hypothetical protein
MFNIAIQLSSIVDMKNNREELITCPSPLPLIKQDSAYMIPLDSTLRNPYSVSPQSFRKFSTLFYSPALT